jgi:penicillin-binding protein 2
MGEKYTTPAPDAKAAARAYLDGWKSENYAGMYALLTQVSKDAIGEDAFSKKYRDVAAQAALSKGIDYSILSSLTNPQSAQVSYRVTLHSALVGDIQRDPVMNLSLENGQWKVQWDDALILPELHGGNYLQMEYNIPARANIYDRNGHALVAQTDAVAVGLDTSQVSQDSQDSLLSLLSEMTDGRLRPETLAPKVDAYRQSGWYLPITDFSVEEIGRNLDRLANYSGVILEPFRTRYYIDAVAPHVVGYMSLIQQDEVEQYQRLGYRVDERVGRDGLELWGEQYLAGKRGGALHVVSPEGKVLTTLADSGTEPAQAIYTTIDRDLQLGAQAALNGFTGAIVVLEKDTGRVLAMASSPGFNPNLFEATNYNSSRLLGTLYGEDKPLLNRATQGQYPLGSVFKIITMSAALQSGVFTPESTYECGYHFTDLPGVSLNDWTWDHYQKDGKTMPSGTLNLPQGLQHSCNPWFYHIGVDLFDRGMTTTVSDMAKAFGLGNKTGFELNEEAGGIPEPATNFEAAINAIGQGKTLVTPLQVADFVAAVGNDGTLYRPSVIEKIVPPSGQPTYTFTSTVRSKLPVSLENLQVVQDAMISVVSKPGGTARQVFPNFPIAIAGKTGTAEDPPYDSDAWFAGYTFENREGKPDIAIAVLLEHAGEGSEWAAPIFKGIVQLYYFGSRSSFPWETQPGVWKTPTPAVTEAPTVEETQAPSP